jgi:prolyl-tRNA synthetase
VPALDQELHREREEIDGMRWSQALINTYKEVPADAQIVSHQLMLRAGLIKKLAAGVYILLPLGVRVVNRVIAIVREELNRAGAQELLMPVLCPAELWQETGRWYTMGPELMRITDRHGNPFVLGPTHEEVITEIARRELKSYRQLPMNLYQVQVKFRDEVRPRFGVMRAREFIMKDGYSFHVDEASLDETYRAMHTAYTRIFERCGLRFAPVEADTGAMGGDVSHEFMVFAESGESEVLHSACGFAATAEQAPVLTRVDAGAPSAAPDDARPLEKVATPGAHTVEQVAAFFSTTPDQLVKTLLYDVSAEEKRRTVAVLIPGDRELNESKLARALGGEPLAMSSAETIARVTGGPVGFSGPVGLAGVTLLADESLRGARNRIVGANAADAHYANASDGRDFRPSSWADLVQARAGDPCPRCGEPLASYRGIEVGQIFKLGRKYADSMDAAVLDESGARVRMTMGCYGIGITRTVAAAIEQNHDESGIIWPRSLAPFEALVVPVNWAHDETRDVATRLYEDLRARGVDTLLDDRRERAGFKFKDADLIGIPVRITIGEKGLAEGKIEIRARRTGETTSVAIADAANAVTSLLESV